MNIETDRLFTVKHYADVKEVTTTAVYAWIAQEKVESVKIDGVTFVIVKDKK